MKNELEVAIPAEEADKRTLEIAHEIEAYAKDLKNVLFIIICKGGIYFGTDVLKQSHLPDAKLDFIIIKNYEGEGQVKKQVIKYFPDAEDVEGMNIILLEDLIDTGRCVSKIERKLKKMGALSIVTACFLRKKKKDDDQISVNVKFIAFDNAKDEWYECGRGFDKQEKGRFLHDLMKKKKLVPCTG